MFKKKNEVFRQFDVLQLKEVGDFHLKCSYEAQMFVEPQICHTKHRAANFF